MTTRNSLTWISHATMAVTLATAGAAIAQQSVFDSGEPTLLMAQASGGEGGEGGEGGVAQTSTAMELVISLGLIEGHLRAGSALYGAQHLAHAATHMKHPQDEIYTSLIPMLAQIGAPGFDAELSVLAEAVASEADADDVDAARNAVLVAISNARQASGLTLKEQVKAMSDILRVAANEYAIGIVDQQVSNIHEYQDAWGFVQVVRAQAQALADSDAALSADLLEQLDTLNDAFPELVPMGSVQASAELLYAAAARVELIGLSLP